MIKDILKPTITYIKHNLPSILSIAGASGLVVTALLTAKATPKAKEIFEEVHKNDEPGKTSVLTVVTAAKPYIPAIVVGGMSIACILTANHLHMDRYSKLVAMYGRLADEYTRFKLGGLDNLMSAAGGGAFALDKDSERIEKALQDIPKLDEEGEVLHWFYDVHSRNWYQSTWDKVRTAAEELNDTFAYQGFAPLFDYYMKLGIYDKFLEPSVGWDCDRLLTEYGCPFIPFGYSEKTYLDGSKAYAVWFPIEPVAEEGYYY